MFPIEIKKLKFVYENNTQDGEVILGVAATQDMIDCGRPPIVNVNMSFPTFMSFAKLRTRLLMAGFTSVGPTAPPEKMIEFHHWIQDIINGMAVHSAGVSDDEHFIDGFLLWLITSSRELVSESSWKEHSSKNPLRNAKKGDNMMTYYFTGISLNYYLKTNKIEFMGGNKASILDFLIEKLSFKTDKACIDGRKFHAYSIHESEINKYQDENDG